MPYWTRILMTAASVAALSGAASAQGEAQDTIDHVSPAIAPVAATPAPALVYAQPTANDIEWVRTGVAAARAGNLEQMREAISSVSHPTARKLLEYLDSLGIRPGVRLSVVSTGDTLELRASEQAIQLERTVGSKIWVKLTTD